LTPHLTTYNIGLYKSQGKGEPVMAKSNFNNKKLSKWARTAVEETHKVKVHRNTKVGTDAGYHIVHLLQKDNSTVYKVVFSTTGRGKNVIGGIAYRLQDGNTVDGEHFEIRGNTVHV
jgi:Na+-transporting NADH:ubiquinone oxidoreductase subunit NqrC